MAEAREPMRGVVRRLGRHPLWVGLGGWTFALLLMSVVALGPLGDRDAARIVATAAPLVVASLLAMSVVLRRRMPSARALGGSGEWSPEACKRVLFELDAISAYTYKAVLLAWAVGLAALLGAVLVYRPDAFRLVAPSLLVEGAVLAAVTAFVARFVQRRNVRQGVELIADGNLEPAEIYEALPDPHQTFRRWWLFFTIHFSVTVLVLAVDAGLALTMWVRGRVFAVKDPAERLRLADSLVDLIALPGLAVTIVPAGVALAMAWIAARRFLEPLEKLEAQARRIARGRFERGVLISAEDECWTVAVAQDRLRRFVEQAAGQLGQTGTRLTRAGEGLSSTLRDQEQGGDEQTRALNQTSSTTEELARSAAQIAGKAAAVEAVAAKTLRAAEGGEVSAAALAQAMARMRSGNEDVAESVLRLNKRVQQIGKVVEFINELADKSDLLALNAELEGTKAGGVGRGFSLVAAELRRLAENVLRSTVDIRNLIQEIRDATNSAVMATEAGMKATQGGAAVAERTLASLGRIREAAERTTDAVRSITLATQQQQSSTSQLASAMAELLNVTQQGSKATRELGASNGDLTELARSLERRAALRAAAEEQ